ncbi:glycosyltransferase family 2 protein [bacterium]|nr:glycosyltransferase family 2 protein [bacterium]
MTYPKVAIIILNYNGWQDTIECLESVLRNNYPNYQVIVVDNGSADDSVEWIREKFPHLTLIETGRNLGYAGGNNIGIKKALENGAKYILIVNNDTKIINPEFVTQMVDVMESDSTIGILGPKVLNFKGQIQDTILYIPTLSNCLRGSFRLRFKVKKSRNYCVTQSVDAVSGVCWFIRSDTINTVGLLDEDYFMYVEEQDYCYRVKKAGWKIMYYPVESVLHKKGSGDEVDKERIYRQYIFARRNLVLFLRKHFGFWKALVLAVLFSISNISKVILSKLTGRGAKFYNFSFLQNLLSEIKYALSVRL